MAHLERIVVEKFYAGDCFGDKLSCWDFGSSSAVISGFCETDFKWFYSDQKSFELLSTNFNESSKLETYFSRPGQSARIVAITLKKTHVSAKNTANCDPDSVSLQR